MSEPEPPSPRAVRVADIERLSAAASHGEPLARLELAHATAAALVEAGRDPDGAHTGQLVTLADTVGLDTLAELWQDADEDTLPGVLWVLYLLRSWCQVQGEAVSHFYRAGRAMAPVDEVVAGVSEDADAPATHRFADAILAGAYRGDFAVALERAAAFFRIVAIGRREVDAGAEDSGSGSGQPADEMAERNERCAHALARAARAWRAGRLR
ncbi:MAG TPA: hypothetical protein VFX70_14235 [Mycobacteriales bacterium]|nr:hypothetical protein [Mycobacteriales bacterium]